jgi:hypothetical protein
MKRIFWDEKLPGDVFFSAMGGPLGRGIADAEHFLHPDYQGGFTPSHAGIVGFDDRVIEAWQSLRENSVAAVNPVSKYDGAEKVGRLQLYRPDGDAPKKAIAITNYLKDYFAVKYGWPNLLGFEYQALVKFLTGKDVTNPLEVSHVCSQGVLIFLGKYLMSEHWAVEAVANDTIVRNCDPLALLMAVVRAVN